MKLGGNEIQWINYRAIPLEHEEVSEEDQIMRDCGHGRKY